MRTQKHTNKPTKKYYTYSFSSKALSIQSVIAFAHLKHNPVGTNIHDILGAHKFSLPCLSRLSISI